MVEQERAARTRRALIQAAAEVFAEVGFVPVSLSVIRRRAGVSNGALHFHFANRRMLAEAVEVEAAEAVRRFTGEAKARQGDSLQRVVDATHELMDLLARDVVLRSGFELAGDIARRAESPLRRQWQAWVEEGLRGAERGGAPAKGSRGRTVPTSSSPRPWVSRCSVGRTLPGRPGAMSPASGSCCCRSSPTGGIRRRW
ncbi:TetR family transcriptional regulator [Streptomyces sp. NPDC052043]|uniref:TetR family transcriptional regulator n=1 Tax=Streptomyces sp. NPDC052043 TaxID=3365684 RepID=UPI0037CF0CCC